MPVLLVFLIIATPVSANEIIRLNQFNNHLKQARDLNAFEKPQEAQEALLQAKEKIKSTLLVKALKNDELKQTEKEIKEMRQSVDERVKKAINENLVTPSPPPTSTPIPIQLKSPTLILTTTPISTPILEKKQSYVYDPYYPIILSLADNKGGQIKYSDYNQYPYSSPNTGIKLRIGDAIRWKAEASDPKGRQILYSFTSNSQRFTDLFGRENGNCKYTINSEVEFTITGEDLKEIGESLRIVLQVRSEKDNYRTGGECGYDDSTFLDYKLQPN